jgi:hypothetical protein
MEALQAIQAWLPDCSAVTIEDGIKTQRLVNERLRDVAPAIIQTAEMDPAWRRRSRGTFAPP